MTSSAGGSQVQTASTPGIQATSNSGGHGIPIPTTEKYIDFLCDLDEASNRGSAAAQSSPPDVTLRKLGIARSTWMGERQLHESRKESRKAEIRQNKTEIYQMIGFYTVVQGVLFQGVSQVAKMESCSKFFGLSVALSGLTSFATLGGVYIKLQDLNRSNEEFADAVTIFQKFDDWLTKLRKEGKGFNWEKTKSRPEDLEAAAVLEKEGRKWPTIFSIVVLLLLVAFSVVFPVSFYEILCVF